MTDLTLVVVGYFGAPTSKTGNCILGGDDSGPFETQNYSRTCELKTAVSNDGQTINVIDTPGFYYTGESRTIYEEELMNCIDLATDGIHAFLLVVSVGTPFSKEERDLIRSLQKVFGESVVNYIILVFTDGHFIDISEQSFAEYLDQGCTDSLKDIIRLCKGRWVLFDTDTEDEVKKSEQVQNLLSQVKTLLAQHGGESFKVDGSTNWYSKGETSVLIQQINKSYEERVTQRIDLVESNVRDTTRRLEQLVEANSATTNVAQRINVVESRLTDTTTRLEQKLEVATLEVQERVEECYKAETSELIRRLCKSYEALMTQRLEEVESRVKDVTTRLERQLAEVEAARLNADERAEKAQKNLIEQIQKLKEADERAEEAQKNSSEQIQKLKEVIERAEKDRYGTRMFDTILEAGSTAFHVYDPSSYLLQSGMK